MKKVSIVITTYHESTKPYLDLCVESVRNLNYPKELIDIVIVGRKSYAPQYDGCKTVFPEQESFAPPVGINCGFKATDPKSSYILMLNDDAMMTKDSLTELVGACGDHEMILNPISPCDNYAYYWLSMGYFKNDRFNPMMDRFYRLRDYGDDVKEMMNAESQYPRGILWMPELCMYATLYPRKVYERLGGWDESLTFLDDIDYSWRASQAGIRLGTVTSALIWHAGGASTEKTLDDSARRESAMKFYKKWGKAPRGNEGYLVK